eukprot:gene25201-30760_t
MTEVAPPGVVPGSTIFLSSPQTQVQPNTVLSTPHGNYGASYNLQSAQAQAQGHIELEAARSVGAQIAAEGGKQIAAANSVAAAKQLDGGQARHVQVGAIRGQVDFNVSEKESKFQNTFAGRALESCVNEVVEWASQQTRKFELALPTTFHDMVKNSLKRQRATETD